MLNASAPPPYAVWRRADVWASFRVFDMKAFYKARLGVNSPRTFSFNSPNSSPRRLTFQLLSLTFNCPTPTVHGVQLSTTPLYSSPWRSTLKLRVSPCKVQLSNSLSSHRSTLLSLALTLQLLLYPAFNSSTTPPPLFAPSKPFNCPTPLFAPFNNACVECRKQLIGPNNPGL